MSETLKTLESRRCCRAYKPELIEEEKILVIIKAGTYAATGMGKQSPIIIAVTNKEVPTYVYDGSLVIGNLMNAAADLGVASC